MSFAGYYNDGQSARRHDVEVYLWGEDLRFRTRDKSIDLQWDGAGLRVQEEAYAGKPLRLAHRDHPDAIITVADPAFAEALIETHPHLSRKMMRGTTAQRLLVWSVVTVAVIGALLFGAPPLAARMAHYVPPEWAASIGEQVVEDFVRGREECEAPDGLGVLRQLADELIARTDYDGPVTLRVVDDEMINAFAAPGGQVIVFRGLIDKASTGEQVAGVLAHELAHVAEDHAMEGIARQLALQFVLMMLIGDVGQLSGAAAGVGGQLIASSYSRGMEAEADDVGVAMLNDAGYTADGLAGFFELLEEEGIGDLPDVLTWLSTHPVHDTRIQSVRAADGGGDSALTGDAWLAVKAICHGNDDDPEPQP